MIWTSEKSQQAQGEAAEASTHSEAPVVLFKGERVR